MASTSRDDRGSVAVVTAATIVVLVLVAAFVVDIGMQRVARRDMQSLADVVALDLTRELDGRPAGTLAPLMPALAAQSRARNGGTLGATPSLTVDLGQLRSDGTFQSVGGTAVPTAVRVSASTTVAFAFGVARSGGATRTAIAQVDAGACFVIGSYAARLDTSTSPLLGTLLGALGSNVSLSVADYNGLANTDIDLLGLLESRLGVGTVEQVIKGNQLVGLGGFYLVAADALERQGGHAAQVTLLRALALTVGNLQLRAGQLLGLGTGGGSGLAASLNLYDLVTASAAAATGQNGISLSQVGVNLGPIANVRSSLRVVEPLKPGCGRKNDPAAAASSSQVSLDLSATAADIDVPGLLKTKVALAGTVTAASADGQLTDVRCHPAGITVGVSDGLITVDLKLEVEVSLNVLGLVIPVVGGPITIKGTKPSTGVATVNIVGNDYSKGVHLGNGSSGLPLLTVNTSGFKLIGLPVGVLLNPILALVTNGLVNPLIQGLDTVLVSPLLNSLGLDLSGVDVFARPTPKCAEPSLRG